MAATIAADILEDFPLSEERATPEGAARLIRTPVGVVGTITPWNAPVPSAVRNAKAATMPFICNSVTGRGRLLRKKIDRVPRPGTTKFQSGQTTFDRAGCITRTGAGRGHA